MKGKIDPIVNEALIGLGSNIDPEHNLLEALRLLGTITTIRNHSSVYQSHSVGSSGPDYLNAAALIETELSLDAVRQNIIAPIEKQLKRVRSADKYMDRTIDLDVIIYNQTVTDPDLWIQAHVALPASEIIPEFINPITGESITQAAKRLRPGSDIHLRVDLS